jgi:hypothetical protein
VLTVLCEINISCFDCASELYSFPETLKTLRRKKFTLQKICKIYISANIKHVYTSLEICMCVHGGKIKSHGPYNCDLCAVCLYTYSDSFVTFLCIISRDTRNTLPASLHFLIQEQHIAYVNYTVSQINGITFQSIDISNTIIQRHKLSQYELIAKVIQ